MIKITIERDGNSELHQLRLTSEGGESAALSLWGLSGLCSENLHFTKESLEMCQAQLERFGATDVEHCVFSDRASAQLALDWVESRMLIVRLLGNGFILDSMMQTMHIIGRHSDVNWKKTK